MTKSTGSLATRLGGGETLCAGWITLDTPAGAESFASRGFDVVVLDQQHGLAHRGNLLTLLQAVQGTHTPALVRVPQNAATDITWALDVGADGVIVPLVDDAAAAARAVAAARYPAAGSRSYGAHRAALRFGDPDTAAKNAAVFVMVETRTGLANLEEIAATPGLTGIFVGPADLGLALGLGPQTDGRHPRHMEALEQIIAACRRHGIASGIYSNDPSYGREMASAGMQLIVIATDASLLAAGAEQRVASWRNG